MTRKDRFYRSIETLGTFNYFKEQQHLSKAIAMFVHFDLSLEGSSYRWTTPVTGRNLRGRQLRAPERVEPYPGHRLF